MRAAYSGGAPEQHQTLLASLMASFWRQWLSGLSILQPWAWKIVDIGLVLLLAYAVLVVIGERRTLWMVRGFIILIMLTALSKQVGLIYLSFVLESLVVGSAVAIAVTLKGEFRRFLEALGRGHLLQLFQPIQPPTVRVESVVDDIVDAVKELSQNRTGALLILETGSPIDERNFSVPGVRLNAEVSKELLQTIFQTSTLLHDGAILIRASRVLAAGVILPISERVASRRLGTRHRAAMGITERVSECLCVVVSEETGSISVAEQGMLNRPLTSTNLRELLDQRFSPVVDRDNVTPNLRNLGLKLRSQLVNLLTRLFQPFVPSALREKK